MKSSEILFLYEVALANPNGSPDSDNQPRMDRSTGTCLVTDVRLKRFFRDYIINKYGEDYIWVSLQDGKHVRAEDRLLRLTGSKDEKAGVKLLKKCIDARLFGALIPIEGKGKKRKKDGKQFKRTGPVQFAWGFSLHKVDTVGDASITSLFSTKKGGSSGGEIEGREGGSIGKDYRVYYALIAFHGAVSPFRARHALMDETDLKILDNLLWETVLAESVTRSKIGSRPLLYMRVEYERDDFYLGDLRRFLEAKGNEGKIRRLSDLTLSFDKLVDALTSAPVSKIYIRHSGEEPFRKLAEELRAKEFKVAELPHKDLTEEIIESRIVGGLQ